MRIYSFPPVVDESSQVLVLGTMPGARSLEDNQYYAHPQNHFWRIISTLFDTALPSDYEVKKQLLLSRHIALWDVLKGCDREGSLDSNIRNAEPNDFKTFFRKYPAIRVVFFNGQKAAQLFKYHVGDIELPEKHVLSSTSPAHTRPFAEKLASWSRIKDVLNQPR